MYYTYSDYLKNKYHEKVYKLPVNLPVTCPNRLSGACGCDFCAEQGTGFEALNHQLSVTEQLNLTREKIEKKYHAHKFIAYFQNYTNTFLPTDRFEKYMREGASFPDVVEIGVDAAHPVQVSNDPIELKAKYGDRITFLGGFDNVGILDREDCTEEETRAEVRRVLTELAPGGSFVSWRSFFCTHPEAYMDEYWKIVGPQKQAALEADKEK